jgi:ribose 1,5-bisphosphokinase PhnN
VGRIGSARVFDGLLDAKAEIIAQQFQHRLERRRLAMRQHPGLEHPDALAAAAFGEFEAEPALADAGLADHADDAPAPVPRHLEQAAQQLELLMTADQRSDAAADGQAHALAAGQA